MQGWLKEYNFIQWLLYLTGNSTVATQSTNTSLPASHSCMYFHLWGDEKQVINFEWPITGYLFLEVVGGPQSIDLFMKNGNSQYLLWLVLLILSCLCTCMLELYWESYSKGCWYNYWDYLMSSRDFRFVVKTESTLTHMQTLQHFHDMSNEWELQEWFALTTVSYMAAPWCKQGSTKAGG